MEIEKLRKNSENIIESPGDQADNNSIHDEEDFFK